MLKSTRQKLRGCMLNARLMVVCFWGVMAIGAIVLADDKPDEWYRTDEARRIADNILTYQDSYGGWPKNIDTENKPYDGDPGTLKGTFDNHATVGQMRFLAKAYVATEEPRYKKAFDKGLDLILKAQYPTGGWPQFYPPNQKYNRYITFNDGVMVRLTELVKEIAISDEYAFVDAEKRADAQKAFDLAIDCILKCQVRVAGKLTVWCAQHDEINYSPRPARSFERASLSGGESCDVLRLLMHLDAPSKSVIRAVNAGVHWYKASTIKGLRLESVDGVRTVIKDASAKPLWARFYEIQTNRPFFCDRDASRKSRLSWILMISRLFPWLMCIA